MFNYVLTPKDENLINSKKIYKFFCTNKLSFDNFNTLISGLKEFTCFCKKNNESKLFFFKSNYVKFNKITQLSSIKIDGDNDNEKDYESKKEYS
jgi:hypothetical protein